MGPAFLLQPGFIPPGLSILFFSYAAIAAVVAPIDLDSRQPLPGGVGAIDPADDDAGVYL